LLRSFAGIIQDENSKEEGVGCPGEVRKRSRAGNFTPGFRVLNFCGSSPEASVGDPAQKPCCFVWPSGSRPARARPYLGYEVRGGARTEFDEETTTTTTAEPAYMYSGRQEYNRLQCASFSSADRALPCVPL